MLLPLHTQLDRRINLKRRDIVLCLHRKVKTTVRCTRPRVAHVRDNKDVVRTASRQNVRLAVNYG